MRAGYDPTRRPADYILNHCAERRWLYRMRSGHERR